MSLFTYIRTCLKSAWFMYVMSVFLSILTGGSIIRIYGSTCGFNIFEPDTWFTSVMVMGSSYCKCLNWLGYLTGITVDNIWIHVCTILMSFLYLKKPDNSGS